ncbi:MAG: hypothetical protein KJO08_05390 [Gammaproteobacteria bacterium]|nr:hypothetical protein [Gammaproteobacteria bacterium]
MEKDFRVASGNRHLLGAIPLHDVQDAAMARISYRVDGLFVVFSSMAPAFSARKAAMALS